MEFKNLRALIVSKILMRDYVKTMDGLAGRFVYDQTIVYINSPMKQLKCFP